MRRFKTRFFFGLFLCLCICLTLLSIGRGPTFSAFAEDTTSDEPSTTKIYQAEVQCEVEEYTLDQAYLEDGVLRALSEYTNVFYLILRTNPYGTDTDSTQYEKQYCKAFCEERGLTGENTLILLVNQSTGWYYLHCIGDINPVVRESGIKYIDETAMDYGAKHNFTRFGERVLGRVYEAITGTVYLTPSKTDTSTSGTDVTSGTDTDTDTFDDDLPELSSDYYYKSETGYESRVLDYAGILSKAEEKALSEEALRPLLKFSNAILVTINKNKFGSSSTSDNQEKLFCSSLYDQYYKNKGNGYEGCVIFLIDMDTRWLYLYREGEIKERLTEAKCDSITDRIYTYASNADYKGCASECFRLTYAVLNGQMIIEPMRIICNVVVSIAAALLLTFLYANSLAKARKAGNTKLLRSSTHTIEFKDVKLLLVRTIKTKIVTSSSGGYSGGSSGGSSSGGRSSGGSSHSSGSRSSGSSSHGGGGGHRF